MTRTTKRLLKARTIRKYIQKHLKKSKQKERSKNNHFLISMDWRKEGRKKINCQISKLKIPQTVKQEKLTQVVTFYSNASSEKKEDEVKVNTVNTKSNTAPITKIKIEIHESVINLMCCFFAMCWLLNITNLDK